jgi:Leucine-rich repeat (LRR) protein
LLRRLSLSCNGFNGSIEPLSTLKQLTSLRMSCNGFNGSIEPLSTLKQLTSLRMFGGDGSGCSLRKNFNGKLPQDIGSLNATAIKELDLSGPGLGGQLPVSFGNLTLLRRLNLSFNSFSGSIGPLATLTGLRALGIGCVGVGSTYESSVDGCGMLTGSLCHALATVTAPIARP